MKHKLAQIISTIGHPLLTVPVVVFALLFQTESKFNLFVVLGLIVFGLIIPVVFKIIKDLKSGKVSNFDVSDQKQRKRFYRFLLPILLVVNLGLYFSGQSFNTLLSFGLATLLLLTLQIVNLSIKASIHVSINVYLTYLLATTSYEWALFYGFFVLFIAWSRLILKNHTFSEIIVGFILGNLYGFLYYSIFIFCFK